jgi:uncharacterized protein YeaO (DUF488 family)
MEMFRLKRVYEAPSPEDGARILVERLWPRGLTKEKAALDLWLKEIVPTPELRQWFNHDVAKWPVFEKRYLKELAGRREEADLLRQKERAGTVTLVYAAHDEEHNSALVLKAFLAKAHS